MRYIPLPPPLPHPYLTPTPTPENNPGSPLTALTWSGARDGGEGEPWGMGEAANKGRGVSHRCTPRSLKRDEQVATVWS